MFKFTQLVSSTSVHGRTCWVFLTLHSVHYVVHTRLTTRTYYIAQGAILNILHTLQSARALCFYHFELYVPVKQECCSRVQKTLRHLTFATQPLPTFQSQL